MAQLPERVAKLEERMDNLDKDISKLTAAVEKLTEVLQNGKGAFKVLLWLVGICSGVASIVSWILDHVDFKGS